MKDLLLERAPTPPPLEGEEVELVPLIGSIKARPDPDENSALIQKEGKRLRVLCRCLIPASEPVVLIYFLAREKEKVREGQKCSVELSSSFGFCYYTGVVKRDSEGVPYLLVQDKEGLPYQKGDYALNCLFQALFLLE